MCTSYNSYYVIYIFYFLNVYTNQAKIVIYIYIYIYIYIILKLKIDLHMCLNYYLLYFEKYLYLLKLFFIYKVF